MTIKITIQTHGGGERTYVNPAELYVYQNKKGSFAVIGESDDLLISSAVETQVLPSKHDERIWCVWKVEPEKEGEAAGIYVDQFQVIGWRMDLSLINGEQLLVPISPAFDLTLITSTNAEYTVLLVNTDLATATPLICSDRTHEVYLNAEEATRDILGFLSHRFSMDVTAAMLPTNVFTDALDSKLIPPNPNSRSA